MLRRFRNDEHEREALVRVVQRTCGQTPPQEPFRAIITGSARPLVSGDTPPTEASLEECFVPGAGTVDQISGMPVYPETLLPAGVPWRRYRWQQFQGNLSSEGCGWRSVGGQLKPWKQAMYAVNTAEVTQDPRLDYPSVNIGTTVLVSFGLIDYASGGLPRWGFFFHFMPDAAGILICTNNPAATVGCCTISQPGAPFEQFCAGELDCLALGGVWVGTGIPCPSVPC